MEKTIRWFAAAFGLAFGSTAGFLASAAPGDLIYEDARAEVQLTAQQATSVANWAISSGVWDGAAADLTEVCVRRRVDEFFAQATGIKAAAPENVPVTTHGVRIVGRVE